MRYVFVYFRIFMNRIFHLAFLALFGLTVAAAAQKDLSIAQIQGSGARSAYAGQSVRTTGIVTARIRSGFFVQTPDDAADKDPATSEGVFVFTRTMPPAEAEVGASVRVSGTLEEFVRETDAYAQPITEIVFREGRDELKVVSKANALPAPKTLTAADMMSNTFDSLERYEGMRVRVDEMLVTSPTGGRIDNKTGDSVSDGAFAGVLASVPRPFRARGRDVRDFASTADSDAFLKAYPKAKLFDGDPEIFRVDSGEQLMAGTQNTSPTINVPALTVLKGLTGVMHYAYARYTIYTDPDVRPTPALPGKANPLPDPGPRGIVVAGMNLENFFDDKDDPGIKEDVLPPAVFERRLKKMSMAIRDLMRSPDVIGTIEVENAAALKRLADRVNADTVAAGGTDPKYDAFVLAGNDGRGINNGFLVKTSRAKVLEIKQFGKDDRYKDPTTGQELFLNDRPPIMVRVAFEDAKGKPPFELTVVANHLKSFLGYNDAKQRDNVRLKKKLQAEFLAKWVQARQTADPKERIVLLGDFNAFQFDDGILDPVGTITGKPAAADSVLNASSDLVVRDLIGLVDFIAPAQRYSYIFDGNAQVLDHILISETLRPNVLGFGFIRVNADQPEWFRNDASRPERFSDHDPAVLLISMDARSPK